MAGKLTDEYILETTEQFFRTGIYFFRVTCLSELEANRYCQVIEGINRYDVEKRGPSILNDPHKAIPLYSVEISLGGGSNA